MGRRLCAVAFAEESWRFPTDEITQEQWQIYLEEVRALPGAEIREAANQILISVPSRLTLYVFTSPAHPAFPAVVIRQIVEVDAIPFSVAVVTMQETKQHTTVGGMSLMSSIADKGSRGEMMNGDAAAQPVLRRGVISG